MDNRISDKALVLLKKWAAQGITPSATTYEDGLRDGSIVLAQEILLHISEDQGQGTKDAEN